MILQTDIARAFAALSATNEAILYAKTPEALYRQVCEAAFSSGDFLATAIFLLEPGTNILRLAAGVGEDTRRLRGLDISTVADAPEGSGVCGQAFRDRMVSISNDFLNDVRSLAWREGALNAHVGAAAALPLMCNGRSVGVLLVTRHEAGSINHQIVSLLERMSANISFCAGQVRTGTGAPQRRTGDGPNFAHVCRAERDQRSHSSCEKRSGDVPVDLPGGIERRQIAGDGGFPARSGFLGTEVHGGGRQGGASFFPTATLP